MDAATSLPRRDILCEPSRYKAGVANNRHSFNDFCGENENFLSLLVLMNSDRRPFTNAAARDKGIGLASAGSLWLCSFAGRAVAAPALVPPWLFPDSLTARWLPRH